MVLVLLWVGSFFFYFKKIYDFIKWLNEICENWILLCFFSLYNSKKNWNIKYINIQVSKTIINLVSKKLKS